jgi:acyl-CoA thioester hydrolase
MDDPKRFKHKIDIMVRFSDLDALGHVNNATYLSYIQDARISYFNRILNRKTDDLKYNAIIARIEIDYKNQISLGDKVTVYTKYTAVGEKSCNVESVVVVNKGDEDIIAANCLSVLVSFDYQLGVATPIPGKWRKAIEEYEGIS